MLKTTYENKMESVAIIDAGQHEQNIALIASAALKRYLGLDPSSCDVHGPRSFGDDRSIFARHRAEYTRQLASLPSGLIASQADAIAGSGLPVVTEAAYEVKTDGTLAQVSPRRVESKPWQLLPGVPVPVLLTQDAKIRDREIERMESKAPQPYARFRNGKWQGRHPDTGEWKTIEENRR